MKKTKKRHKLPQKIFFIIGIALTIIIILTLALMTILFLQPKEYKNGKEYHQHNLQALYNAMSNTKQLAHGIHFNGNKIADEGKDFGCDISDNEFSPNIVNCTYHYYVFFLGTGNPKKDVSDLYKQIKLAGWDDQGMYNEYINSKRNIFDFPISFKNPNIPQNIPYIYLNFDMINRKNNTYPSRFLGEEYRKLMNKYVYGSNNKNAYIYGYDIRDTYFHAECHDCKLGLMYPAQHE